MFLNDAFDVEFDRRARPERPIPAGRVARSEVFLVGSALVALGLLLLVPKQDALLLGVALAVAVFIYDYHHKNSRIAPLVMGTCRGLVYGISAASAGELTAAVGVGAAVMATYVAMITTVARVAGSHVRWLVPALIAGISLVDAAFIAMVSSSTSLALLAAIGSGLTLSLQRLVPGD
jgi:4-hydroxybenzoate polyprenyltransferase